jgi:hypothetical protein
MERIGVVAELRAIEHCDWPAVVAEGPARLESRLASQADIEIEVLSRAPFSVNVTVHQTKIKVFPAEALQTQESDVYRLLVDDAAALMADDGWGLAIASRADGVAIAQLDSKARATVSPLVFPAPPSDALKALEENEDLQQFIEAVKGGDPTSDWSQVVAGGLAFRLGRLRRVNLDSDPQAWFDLWPGGIDLKDRLVRQLVFRVEFLRDFIEDLEEASRDPSFVNEINPDAWCSVAVLRDDIEVVREMLPPALQARVSSAIETTLADIDHHGPALITSRRLLLKSDGRLRHVTKLRIGKWWRADGYFPTGWGVARLAAGTSESGPSDLVEILGDDPPIMVENHADTEANRVLGFFLVRVDPLQHHTFSTVTLFCISPEGERVCVSAPITEGAARLDAAAWERLLPGQWYEIRLM